MIIDVPIVYEVDYIPSGKRKNIIGNIKDSFPMEIPTVSMEPYANITAYHEAYSNTPVKKEFFIHDGEFFEKLDGQDVFQTICYRADGKVNPNYKTLNYINMEDVKKILSDNRSQVIQDAKEKIAKVVIGPEGFLYKKVKRPMLTISKHSIDISASVGFHEGYDLPLEVCDNIKLNDNNVIEILNPQEIPQDEIVKNILQHISKAYIGWALEQMSDESLMMFVSLRRHRNDIDSKNHPTFDDLKSFMDEYCEFWNYQNKPQRNQDVNKFMKIIDICKKSENDISLKI